MPRNLSVDIMRVIGLSLIILAHVNPPEFLFQLRSFDVPLMVFVSGLAYYYAGKIDVDFKSYIISRLERLILPVWFFLTFFFICIYIFNFDGFRNLLSIKMIISSYLLYGFGYLWIIRVFLIIAILSPCYVYAFKRFNDLAVTILCLALISLASLLSLLDAAVFGKVINHLLDDIITPALSYGAVFILGYRAPQFQNNHKKYSMFIFLLSFLGCVIYNLYVNNIFYPPQNFKYPPTIYFIAFSLVMVWLTYFAIDIFFKEKRSLYKPIKFIAANTIWIYLWHIPVVEYFKRYSFDHDFEIKYIIALSLPISIVSTQVYLVKKYSNNKKNVLKKLLTG